MNFRNLRLVFPLLFSILSLAVGGCTGRGDSQDASASEMSGSAACFIKNQVSDFRALDRTNLIIYAPSRSNAYHVQITPPSIELRSANTLAFISSGNRICGYAGDAVILGNDNFRKYSVSRVTRLDKAGVDALNNGTAGNDMDPDAEDARAVGADIERGDDSRTSKLK
jgi:hypothetical protein